MSGYIETNTVYYATVEFEKPVTSEKPVLQQAKLEWKTFKVFESNKFRLKISAISDSI